MAKKIPASQEGRTREARRHRKLSRLGKASVVTVTVVAVAMWSYLFAMT